MGKRWTLHGVRYWLGRMERRVDNLRREDGRGAKSVRVTQGAKVIVCVLGCSIAMFAYLDGNSERAVQSDLGHSRSPRNLWSNIVAHLPLLNTINQVQLKPIIVLRSAYLRDGTLLRNFSSTTKLARVERHLPMSTTSSGSPTKRLFANFRDLKEAFIYATKAY